MFRFRRCRCRNPSCIMRIASATAFMYGMRHFWASLRSITQQPRALKGIIDAAIRSTQRLCHISFVAFERHVSSDVRRRAVSEEFFGWIRKKRVLIACQLVSDIGWSWNKKRLVWNNTTGLDIQMSSSKLCSFCLFDFGPRQVFFTNELFQLTKVDGSIIL